MNAMPGIFWYWNADPTPNGIRRQLTQIRAAGFRSVYLHPMPDNFRKSDFKSGMKMRYLGRKFFRLARTAVDECRRLGLRFMIYDEGGWPSGTANGELVKRRPEFGIHVLERRADGSIAPRNAGIDCGYPDLMNARATKLFLTLVHERYRRELGDEFGRTIGGIFTDENGNKDVFMGCINGCSATLTQCEYTCGHYHTCDTVAVANDLLRDEELGKEGNDKKYLFPESNVIDMSKLYKDGEDVMFYWCNACGEVNLPGDIGIVLHEKDELPLHIQSIYANLECECNETNEYAASICNRSGILLMALYPYQFVADVLKIDEQSQKAQDATEQFALNLKAFSNNLLAEFKKVDPNCEVVLGIHTDPEGPELGVFIPFFEDEKPVENNLSAVRKRFNEIAYSDAVRNLIRKGVNSNG